VKDGLFSSRSDSSPHRFAIVHPPFIPPFKPAPLTVPHRSTVKVKPSRVGAEPTGEECKSRRIKE
jgi:hypothetical protein